jgi:hypothetical protein
MGDFMLGVLGREGRRDRLGLVNVVLSAFHEGRAREKRTTLGGSLEKECLDNIRKKKWLR